MAFVAYVAGILAILGFMGGGLNSKSHILLAGSSVFFLVWWKDWIKGKLCLQNWSTVFLLGFIFFSLLSYVLSGTGNVGMNEMIATVVGGIIFIVGTEIFKEKKSIDWMMRVVVLLGIVGSLVGFGIYIFFRFNRFAGVFLDVGSYNGFYPNGWVDLLIMAMGTAGYLISKGGRDKWLGAVSFLFFLPSLLLTYSRGGWISFVGALVLAVGFGSFVWADRIEKNWLKWAGGVLVVAVLSIGIVWGTNSWRGANDFDVETFTEKAALEGDEEKSSVNERFEFFKGGMKMMVDSPYVGYGPYSFRYVFPRHQVELLSMSDHAHNVFLKYGGERGIPALLMFVLFLGSIVVAGWKAFHDMENDQRSLLVMIGAALAGVLAHNLIDYNLNFLVNHVLFWVLLAVIMGVSGKCIASSPKVSQRTSQILGVIMILFVVELLIVAGHEAYYGWSLSKARALSSVNLEIEERFDAKVAMERINHYEDAMNLWERRDVPVALMSDYIRVGNMFAAENLGADMTAIYPLYSEVWYLWGESLRLQGRPKEAFDKFMKALSQDPMNELRYYEGMYLTVLALKDEELKEEWEMRVREILEVYVAKLKTNSHYTVLTGNPRAALELYRLIGDKAGAEEVRRIFELEVDKLERPEVYFGENN